MAHYYYVTAHKSTAVTSCVSGRFTSHDQLNLLLAKNNRIEIYLVGPEGLKLMKELNIYGKIIEMKLFRPPNSNKDMLFLITAKYDVMILACQGNDDELEIYTKAHGNVTDKIGIVSDLGVIAIIDPTSQVIVLRIYTGVLKIIPLEDSYELKATNMRLEETDVVDINFLHNCANPTIILLYVDNNGRHIKTHEISLKEREFGFSPWKQDNIEAEASVIISIPEPLGGVVIIGQESILYHDGTTFFAVGPSVIRNSTIICYAKVDAEGYRHVLGDLAGNLFMLLLITEERADGTLVACDMKVEVLGEVSIPKTLTYLDNGVFFIGSRVGDSQLIKLNKNIDPESGSYITVMDTFCNLAPILDMVVVDLEGQGNDQVVTCSGTDKEGSLRIIRSGITIHEQATIELGGIKGVWALNFKSGTGLHNCLALSFVGQTRVLYLNGEEVEEIQIPGFLTDQQTMYCENISNTQILQIVPTVIKLVCVEPKEVVYEWRPPCGKSINVVACNNFQIACASGSQVYYLEIVNNQIIEKKLMNLDNEVACLDISPSEDCNESRYLAVGLWNDITIRVLSIPTLVEVYKEYLGGDIIPRSLLFAFLENKHFLFCGLGNGALIYFNLNNSDGSLLDRKRITLGTQPVVLQKFNFLGTSTVFACSDLPTVMYSVNYKLIFSNVNIKRIHYMCSLNSDGFPESLALVTDNVIVIGTMNEIQKLHIRTVPLGESPKRIAYQESSQTFGVISQRQDLELVGNSTRPDCASLRASSITHSTFTNTCIHSSALQISEHGIETEVYNLLVLDQHSFEVTHAYQMLPSEYCLSLISTKLGDDPTTYYIVGTAFVNPEDSEPKLGRIVMFSLEDGKLIQVADQEVKGACYSLCEFNGKLVGSVGCTVRLFEWTKEKELRVECSHFQNLVALYLKTKGDFVLVGDIMKSMSLIQHKPIHGNFEEICKDYNPNWMTAIEILDDDIYLGAENAYNLFICQKDSSSTNDEDREKMQEAAMFHLGDLVNVFRKGRLGGSDYGEISNLKDTNVLLGTASGAIGLITSVSKELFDTLLELQSRLSHLIKPAGKIEHSHWRSFSSFYRVEPPKGIVDGDLVECFLDLSRGEMLEAIAGLKIVKSSGESEEISVDSMLKIVEELSRMH